MQLCTFRPAPKQKSFQFFPVWELLVSSSNKLHFSSEDFTFGALFKNVSLT